MRYLSIFALALFLGLNLTFVTPSSSSVHAATYYVDDDTCPDQGSGTEADPFCSIQSGINVASTGDIVQVAAGTYFENITMKSGVWIQGAGQGVSIIDGGASGSVVTATNVDSSATLDRFTITGGLSDYGGGMYNENSSPTVTNCSFSGNFATDGGGGMENYYYSSPTVTDCTFSGNTTPFFGGGMENDEFSSPTVESSTFSGNLAGDSGGGMFNYWYSSPTVTNCIFSANTADSAGGGMMNDGDSTPMVTNCTFSENSAIYYGGGMENDESSSPTVTNCTFSGNSADWGGGMFNYWYSSPTVTNCTFSENSAEEGGGMLNEDNASPTVESCTFSANIATSWGGGMYNYLSSWPTLTNCTFSENSATYGGGMFNETSSSPTVTNCTFSGNSATYGGGGLLNEDNASPTVTNSILWGDSPDEIYNSNSSPSVTYSDIQGGYAGTGNINADPMFVESADGNFHLQQGSPCIDAGDNSAPALPVTDIDGDDRRIDDPTVANTGNGTPPIVDMGADEFVPAPAINEITFDQCISELCTSAISVSAHDPAGGNLTYDWQTLNGGAISGSGPDVSFDPPNSGPHACPYQVELTITSDASGLSTSHTIDIYVKLAGNVNGDGNVNVVDKVLVRNAFGQSGYPGWIDADVNCDGYVNVVDKVLVRNQFGDISCGCP